MSFSDRRTILGLSVPAWIGIGLTLGGIAWLVWFLISLGPKKVEGLALPGEMNGAQWRGSREIDAIEQAYREAGETIPADLEARLNHAIQLQEQLLKSGVDAGEGHALRLDRLLVARDTIRARAQWDRLTALEERLAATTADDARVAVLEDLLVLRREINRSRATARYKDLVRETQLEREYESLRAGPLRARADEEQRLAQQAAAALRNPADYAGLQDGAAEWLDGPPGQPSAPVWPADGTDVPVQRPRDARARDLGFRVVVEADAAAN